MREHWEGMREAGEARGGVGGWFGFYTVTFGLRMQLHLRRPCRLSCDRPTGIDIDPVAGIKFSMLRRRLAKCLSRASNEYGLAASIRF